MEPIHVDGEKFFVTAVSMGNPHAVIYVDELTDEMVLGYGKKLESHTFFLRRQTSNSLKFYRKRDPHASF